MPVAPAPPVAPSSPATQRAAVPAAMANERKWLQSWFESTPVLIAQRSDGAITLDVPREFCFEPGRSSVKPALAAVLNKVAESLQRVPLARLPLLAAPDDATGTATLAMDRAVQVHKHLLSRGVPAARLGKPTATTAAAVQLRIELPAP
jgi:outer membrane protein OmpA-like peptidoglycan-associated protein